VPFVAATANYGIQDHDGILDGVLFATGLLNVLPVEISDVAGWGFSCTCGGDEGRGSSSTPSLLGRRGMCLLP
jgi:hypothetical protein